jgi:hypothetical protein
MGYFEDLLLRAKGTAGKVLTGVGTALGAPQLVPGGLGIQYQSEGSAALTPEQRIAESLKQTGAIAEGDYALANSMGLPYAPSRADGGILTNQAQQDNSTAVTKTRQQWIDQGVNPDSLTTNDGVNFRQPTPSTGGGSGYDFNAAMQRQRDLARGVYNEGLRRAGSAYDRARGLFDEGSALLGKKRDQFKETFDQGSGDILNAYEGERGNLQASAQNAASKSANLLRAMGLGGSAAIKSEGRLRQQNTKQAGTLSTERSLNDRANLGQFNDNQDWANTQESTLTRGLNDAAEARRSAENQAGLVEAGDVNTINDRMGGFLNTILQNQLALEAANSGVGAKTVNPYAVNISDLASSLGTQVPTVGGVASTGDQAANVVDPNALDQIKKRQASSGLYGRVA